MCIRDSVGTVVTFPVGSSAPLFWSIRKVTIVSLSWLAASRKVPSGSRAKFRGVLPRNFALDPEGTFLLAANQDSDTIVTFRIDQKRGALEPTGNVTTVPT